MKLRIQDNQIRFRLSVSELESLSSGEFVSMKTPFCNSFLKTCLMTGTSQPFVRHVDNGIFISFPYHYYLDLKESESEGFDFEFVFTNEEKLKVSVEKDFKCIGRPEKDNKGLFPNPKELSGAC